jgi:DNA helicase-2/ATP-dependent DNA helicase PcrA
VAGTRFYERKEIKDIVAYLRLIHNPLDTVSLMRIINVPPRGIGQTSLDQLTAWAASQRLAVYDALLQLAGQENPAVSVPFNSRVTKMLVNFTNLLKDLIEQSQTLGLAGVFRQSGYTDRL